MIFALCKSTAAYSAPLILPPFLHALDEFHSASKFCHQPVEAELAVEALECVCVCVCVERSTKS
jgi:hypothetical protein